MLEIFLEAGKKALMWSSKCAWVCVHTLVCLNISNLYLKTSRTVMVKESHWPLRLFSLGL